MAQQTINIGSVANDGTGDPIRDAFAKVNENFTELYQDDAGDVNSVTAGTGISVNQTTGAVTVTNTAPDQTVSLTNGGDIAISGTYPSFTLTNSAPNATHTGDVTGATTLTISDDVVNYDMLSPEFNALVAQDNMSYGQEAIHTGTLTGDAVLNIIGVKQGSTKTAIFTGGTSLGFGGTVGSTYNIIAGTYDPAVDNFIQVFASGVSPNQDFYITISQPTV